MPQTTIKIRTWRCSDCDYAQDFEPTDELMTKHFGRSGALCPSCKKENLVKEINPDKKTEMTVMGEEDIETEIMRDDEEKVKEGKTKRTEAEKTAYRAKRKKDIVEAIVKAKQYEDK